MQVCEDFLEGVDDHVEEEHAFPRVIVHRTQTFDDVDGPGCGLGVPPAYLDTKKWEGERGEERDAV